MFLFLQDNLKTGLFWSPVFLSGIFKWEFITLSKGIKLYNKNYSFISIIFVK